MINPAEVSRETLIARHFPDVERVHAYAKFLETAGIERGLIGPREADRIWERHIFNCLPVTTLFTEGATVFDIGSGAGLPGIVIALARPDLKVTLLEPLQRRIDFLEEVVAELGIEISVKRGRAESFKGGFSYVTARAVAPLPKLASVSWHLVMGVAIIAMIPPICVVILMQKWFVKGLIDSEK